MNDPKLWWGSVVRAYHKKAGLSCSSPLAGVTLLWFGTTQRMHVGAGCSCLILWGRFSLLAVFPSCSFWSHIPLCVCVCASVLFFLIPTLALWPQQNVHYLGTSCSAGLIQCNSDVLGIPVSLSVLQSSGWVWTSGAPVGILWLECCSCSRALSSGGGCWLCRQVGVYRPHNFAGCPL